MNAAEENMAEGRDPAAFAIGKSWAEQKGGGRSVCPSTARPTGIDIASKTEPVSEIHGDRPVSSVAVCRRSCTRIKAEILVTGRCFYFWKVLSASKRAGS